MNQERKLRCFVIPWGEIVRIGLILALIQGLRVAAGAGLRAVSKPDLLTWDLTQVALFGLLGVGVVLMARQSGDRLVFRPDLSPRQSKMIYLGAGIFLFFMILSSIIMNNFAAQFTVQQLSSVIVVPLFEELLFRGWAWNRLENQSGRGWVTLIVTLALFSLWHLGYADTVAFRMAENGKQGDLVNIMLMKTVIGAGYGLVTGFVRLKARNCSASFLIHALLNLFGR